MMGEGVASASLPFPDTDYPVPYVSIYHVSAMINV